MIGQTVGKYRIIDRLGRGGMGTVYKALDETLHRDVAIKVLNAELDDPEVARRFRSEAITVARLSHPGIAGIYELFEHQGEWLMVMEFVRGETVEGMLNRMGQLSVQRAADICMQALAALAHAHSLGVVHRDLKPANLMVTENGSIKVMDFGIARVAGSEHLTNAGFMMGTPAYMAPEQVKGGDIDARADLYALGVVFYRLVTGRLPFNGETPFAMVQSQVNDPPTPVGMVRADLPPWVGDIIGRALAKAPEERFQSAGEFHEAFARCLAGLPLSSMYASGDPSMTPSRAMPTGQFQHRPMPTPAAGFHTGSHPTMAAPGTNPGAILTPTDPTMMATPVATPTAAMPGVQAAQAAPAGATGAVLPVPTPPTVVVKKSMPMSVVAMIVGAVLVGSVAVAFIIRDGGDSAGPAAESTPAAADPEAAIDPAAAGASAGGGAGTATDAGAAGATGQSAPATGQGAGPSVTQTPGGRQGTAPTASAPRTGAAPAAGTTGAGAGTGTAKPAASAADAGAKPPAPNAALSDTLVTFPGARLYTVTNGRNTRNVEVVLNFAGGQVLVMPRNGGAAIATIPYRNITSATYIRARDPRWDKGLAFAPDGVDVGSMLRQSQHWLVVQGKSQYGILRLDDSNWQRVIETVEARIGIKVKRP